MVGDPTRPWQVGSRVHRGLIVAHVWLLTEARRGTAWHDHRRCLTGPRSVIHRNDEAKRR